LSQKSKQSSFVNNQGSRVNSGTRSELRSDKRHESALRGSCYGLLGWGFVVLFLVLLFLFRQLLLLVLFLVFLATLVSHACSFFSDCA
jgi:hypothetical protein